MGGEKDYQQEHNEVPASPGERETDCTRLMGKREGIQEILRKKSQQDLVMNRYED